MNAAKTEANRHAPLQTRPVSWLLLAGLLGSLSLSAKSQPASAVQVDELMFPATIDSKEYQLEARIYRPAAPAVHPFIVMNHGRVDRTPHPVPPKSKATLF